MKKQLCFVWLILLAWSCAPKEVSSDEFQVDQIRYDRLMLSDGGEFAFPLGSPARIYVYAYEAQDSLSAFEGSAKWLHEVLKGTRIDHIFTPMDVNGFFLVDEITRKKGLSIMPYDSEVLSTLKSKMVVQNIGESFLLLSRKAELPALLTMMELDTGFVLDSKQLLMDIILKDGNHLTKILSFPKDN